MALPPGLLGRRLGPTAWRVVEQADIDAFARITRDRQWIHVDVERAERESPYGTTIAHGTLLLALLDGFRDELVERQEGVQGFASGWEGVRFLTAVPAGARVRAGFEITEVEPREGGWRIVESWTMELEGAQRPALVGQAIGRVLDRTG